MENIFPLTQGSFAKRIVFVFAIFFLDFFSVVVLNSADNLGSSPAAMMITMGAFTGFLLGQTAFALIWSGFFCQTWTRSFFGALGLAIVVCYLVLLAADIGTRIRHDASRFFYPLVIPLFAVAGNVPLWIARYLRGWRFESSRQSAGNAPPMGIEDILHLTAIVAASIMLSRTVASSLGGVEVFGRTSLWLTLLLIATVFGLLSAPITLLSARFCTGSRSEDRVAKTFFLGVMTFGLLAFAALGRSGGNVPWEFIGYIGISCLFGYGTLWVGLSATIGDGLQFTVRGKAAEKPRPVENQEDETGSPFQDSPFANAANLLTESRVSRKLDRTLVAGFVLVVVLFGVWGAKRNKLEESPLQNAETVASGNAR